MDAAARTRPDIETSAARTGVDAEGAVAATGAETNGVVDLLLLNMGTGALLLREYPLTEPKEEEA